MSKGMLLLLLLHPVFVLQMLQQLLLLLPPVRKDQPKRIRAQLLLPLAIYICSTLLHAMQCTCIHSYIHVAHVAAFADAAAAAAAFTAAAFTAAGIIALDLG